MDEGTSEAALDRVPRSRDPFGRSREFIVSMGDALGEYPQESFTPRSDRTRARTRERFGSLAKKYAPDLSEWSEELKSLVHDRSRSLTEISVSTRPKRSERY